MLSEQELKSDFGMDPFSSVLNKININNISLQLPLNLEPDLYDWAH